jgi:phosphate transport system substrate-binding protein
MRRASMELRFETGSYTPDTRAMQDIDRLARHLLQSSGMAGKRFLIAGFADSDGAWPTNDKRAYKRAETVADHLRRAGVRVVPTNIRSFAYLAPVACNDTDAGKSKNRRVEVWIAR